MSLHDQNIASKNVHFVYAFIFAGIKRTKGPSKGVQPDLTEKLTPLVNPVTEPDLSAKK
jgi:hypothetical protein